ncbi:hypothetical protein K7G19_17995 [Cupriavidus sp. DB3]|nr:hypothetical protein [Cupriavidus sp. DB3]MCA7085483.1 hypothetical protein [Cupriavidus sp. DB3]
MREGVTIFEPVLGQQEEAVPIDPAFLPLRSDNARPAWRELQLLIALYREGTYLRHGLTGLFSPKFALKARMPGQRFLEFAQAALEADVVFINPFPQIGYWSYNVWVQGEGAHPGLTCAAQKLLDASGVALHVRETPRHGPGTLAYCNFWVGSARFWERYVGGVLEPIARFLETEPEHPAALEVMRDTAHTDAAPYLPFIVERLFSTFLSQNDDLRVRPYVMGAHEVPDYCINDFERLLYSRLRDEVDAADRTGYFPSDLRERMDLGCCLWQQHFFDLYCLIPHPHTGRRLSAV